MRTHRRTIHPGPRTTVHLKPHLPHKTCAACGRPFAWRRKWARCWDQVRYCSAACRTRARRELRR